MVGTKLIVVIVVNSPQVMRFALNSIAPLNNILFVSLPLSTLHGSTFISTYCIVYYSTPPPNHSLLTLFPRNPPSSTSPFPRDRVCEARLQLEHPLYL